MTADQISALLSQRNSLLQRRDVEHHVDTSAIDSVLDAECKPGEDNRVDLALGRPCAVLPERIDYHVNADELTAQDIIDMEERTAETASEPPEHDGMWM